MIKTTRYTGQLSEVRKLVKGCEEDKEKLIERLREQEQTQQQMEEAERLSEALPQEIDKLLKSGRMDNATVENLARKRAHLDLLPARMEHLQSLLDAGSADILEPIAEAVHKAACKFFDVQVRAATEDLMKLDADEDLANRQALLRPDLQGLHPSFCVAQTNAVGPLSLKIRTLLWFLESFEEGLPPICENAAKIKQKWLPEE
jgi:hypothetical protein